MTTTTNHEDNNAQVLDTPPWDGPSTFNPDENVYCVVCRVSHRPLYLGGGDSCNPWAPGPAIDPSELDFEGMMKELAELNRKPRSKSAIRIARPRPKS